MASLTPLEKKCFENILNMAGGYVLDFSDRSFGEFFRDSVGINITDVKYTSNGGSKAKKLRAFWEKETDRVVGKALKEMLEIWLYENPNQKENQDYKNCQKTIERLLGTKNKSDLTEDEFLQKEFGDFSIAKLPIEPGLLPVLESRLEETLKCLKVGSPLAIIFLCGSILEGILLSIAISNPKVFNQSKSSPKDKDGKTKKFEDWGLGNYIDVAYEIGILKLDVKKFSHALRDFRNYIHPYEQMCSGFYPDMHTAKICFQVLKAAVAELIDSSRPTH
ncbi:hypothetical protein [Nitrospina watsonii]|nr:hypothetical protein [Nitrospina watsonii]